MRFRVRSLKRTVVAVQVLIIVYLVSDDFPRFLENGTPSNETLATIRESGDTNATYDINYGNGTYTNTTNETSAAESTNTQQETQDYFNFYTDDEPLGNLTSPEVNGTLWAEMQQNVVKAFVLGTEDDTVPAQNTSAETVIAAAPVEQSQDIDAIHGPFPEPQAPTDGNSPEAGRTLPQSPGEGTEYQYEYGDDNQGGLVSDEYIYDVDAVVPSHESESVNVMQDQLQGILQEAVPAQPAAVPAPLVPVQTSDENLPAQPAVVVQSPPQPTQVPPPPQPLPPPAPVQPQPQTPIQPAPPQPAVVQPPPPPPTVVQPPLPPPPVVQPPPPPPPPPVVQAPAPPPPPPVAQPTPPPPPVVQPPPPPPPPPVVQPPPPPPPVVQPPPPPPPVVQPPPPPPPVVQPPPPPPPVVQPPPPPPPVVQPPPPPPPVVQPPPPPPPVVQPPPPPPPVVQPPPPPPPPSVVQPPPPPPPAVQPPPQPVQPPPAPAQPTGEFVAVVPGPPPSFIPADEKAAAVMYLGTHTYKVDDPFPGIMAPVGDISDEERQYMRMKYSPPPITDITYPGHKLKIVVEYARQVAELTNHFIDLNLQNAEDFVFVTAASTNHFEESRDAVASMQTQFPGRKILYFDLGLKEEDVKELKKWESVEYRWFNFTMYPGQFAINLRRSAWKPFIVAEALMEYGGVFYMDSSIRLMTHDLNPAYRLAQWNGGFVHFHASQYSIYAATHEKLFSFLPTKKSMIKNMPMNVGGAFLVYNTDSVYRNILWFWCMCTLDKTCYIPTLEMNCDMNNYDKWKDYMHCHKFDTSIQNILVSNMHGYDNNKYLAPDGMIAVEKMVTSHYKTKYRT